MQDKKGIGHEIIVWIKGFFVAFSMYSKVPMPQFPWQDENMKYAICHFPVIGVLIGLLTYGWNQICMQTIDLPEITRICIAVLIPVILTGGIHVDGYMDTCDALHSYQPRERKLEILKDSHIGAFSVIMLFVLTLFYIGAYAMLNEGWQFALMGCVFILSRILSGLSVVTFPNAKKEGTLYSFSSHAHRKVVRVMLTIELCLCVGMMYLTHLLAGAITFCGAILVFAFYYGKSKKEFGGITGDLAGWFLCICEVFCCGLIGILGVVLGG